MGSPFTLRKQIVEVGAHLYDRGLLAGTDGNISARLDEDRIMITPAGLAKGRMVPDDMVIVDINGKHLDVNELEQKGFLSSQKTGRNRPFRGTDKISRLFRGLSRYSIWESIAILYSYP